jgi:hypothetical protein
MLMQRIDRQSNRAMLRTRLSIRARKACKQIEVLCRQDTSTGSQTHSQKITARKIDRPAKIVAPGCVVSYHCRRVLC